MKIATPQIRVASVLFVSVFAFAWLSPRVASSQASVSDEQIREYIEQLGDDRYRVRSRASEKLQRLGLEAFDELRMAIDREDHEIATAAKFLLSSLLVSWSKDSDPAPVRDALREYGGQDKDVRETRIERIASLRDRQGLAALARLVRFEPDMTLSRRAAIALMQQPISGDPSVRQSNAKKILDVLQKSQRPSATWLSVYAQDLSVGKYSVDAWRDVLKQQRREIDAGTTNQNSRVSVLELVRICAARANQLGNHKEAIRLASDNIDLIAPTTRDLVEACSWSVENELYEFVLLLQDKHARIFTGNPTLLYSVAQAKLLEGKADEAKELAKKALSVNGFPEDPDEREKLSDNEIEEKAQAHLLVAQELAQRGLFDWAEGEYRHIISGVKVTSLTGANARSGLAEMLGELQKHSGVIETLQPIIDRYKRDRLFKNKADMSRTINMPFLESQSDFHKGLQAKSDNDLALARSSLLRAYRRYPRNIDILIAMYRVDGDNNWRLTVDRDLASRVRTLESQLKSAELGYRQRGQRPDDAMILSQLMNEYAWLVSNTEGDLQRALQESVRSLELTPDDGAKLDTCARCYFSLGKLEKARETQLRAIKRMPHSPPLMRQLEEIENAIAQAETSPVDAGE